MHPTPDLHVLGHLRPSGGAPEAAVPGKRAVELVIRWLMAGGSLPRRDLGARMWPESDPKSRDVQLYQCRRRWRDWIGRGDEGCPVPFEATVVRYAGDLLQCDLATAMALEAAVLARPDDDSAVVRLVSDFVGLMGGQEESALALGSWPDLRAEYLQRAATVLDAGIVSARRLDLPVVAPPCRWACPSSLDR